MKDENVEKLANKFANNEIGVLTTMVDELSNIRENAEVMKSLIWSLFDEMGRMSDEERVLISLLQKRANCIIERLDIIAN